MVYICSPFSGDIESNRKNAADYCQYAMSCGVTPVAPHLLFPQFLDDSIPAQRELGMRMGLELMEKCDGVWVMGDVISKGMQSEIAYAKANRIPVEYFSSEMIAGTEPEIQM